MHTSPAQPLRMCRIYPTAPRRCREDCLTVDLRHNRHNILECGERKMLLTCIIVLSVNHTVENNSTNIALGYLSDGLEAWKIHCTGNIAEKLINKCSPSLPSNRHIYSLTLRLEQSHTSVRKGSGKTLQFTNIIAHENPQYCSFSYPIAFEILSISLATVEVEMYSRAFGEDSFSFVPKTSL